MRLDNFLLKSLKGIPKTKIYSIIRKGEVRVNSKRAKPMSRIKTDDLIRIPPNLVLSKKVEKKPKKLEVSEKITTTPESAPEVPKSGKSSASPKVRKFARELGADISAVQGTQRSGRVSEDDVKNFVRSQVTVSGGKVENKKYIEEYSHEEFGEIQIKDIPRVKKLSGPHLVRSWTEIPHVTQHEEIDITEMEQFRSSLYDYYSGEKIKVTPLAFILSLIHISEPMRHA